MDIREDQMDIREDMSTKQRNLSYRLPIGFQQQAHPLVLALTQLTHH